MGLGDECKRLDGSYENEEFLLDAEGRAHALRLTDLFPEQLPGRDADEALRVSLFVTATKQDKHGDTFASLHVAANLPSGDIERNLESFCVKQMLAFSIAMKSTTLPLTFFEAHQDNARLSLDSEGNLIARIGTTGGGLAVIVPFGWGTVRWARFKPAAR